MIAPHTIVRLKSSQAFRPTTDLPSWAAESLTEPLWMVVRRGSQTAGIPVGLRGNSRSQRLAGTVQPADIDASVTPEQLVTEQRWQTLPQSRQMLPVFLAMPEVVPILSDYRWGIAGSAGFELTTGKPTSNQNSDLDLIMPLQQKISVADAQALLAKLNQFNVHIDLQVVHGQNGFSLEEYANQRSSTMLMKTMNGPELVHDPWLAVQQE